MLLTFGLKDSGRDNELVVLTGCRKVEFRCTLRPFWIPNFVMIANVKAFVRLHFGIVLVTLSFLLLATTRLSGKLGQNTIPKTVPQNNTTQHWPSLTPRENLRTRKGAPGTRLVKFSAFYPYDKPLQPGKGIRILKLAEHIHRV